MIHKTHHVDLVNKNVGFLRQSTLPYCIQATRYAGAKE